MKHARFRRERSPDILVCGVGSWPKARNLPKRDRRARALLEGNPTIGEQCFASLCRHKNVINACDDAAQVNL
jgi:hypothetical protein